jgi:hypothetical protein
MLESIRGRVSSVLEFNFDRLNREVTHAYNVSRGVTKDGVPEYVGSLEEEIHRLSRYYPALKHLTVDFNQIVIHILTASVRLTEDELKIEGDISSMERFSAGIKHVVSSETDQRFENLEL